MFGLLALLARVSTEGALFVYLGMVLGGLGLAMLVLSVRFRDKLEGIWFWIVVALMDIGAAAFIFFQRSSASEAFQTILGAWMIFMGLSFAIMAIRQKSPNAMMLVNAGISSAFGLIIIFDPFKSPEFMNFVVGFGTIALGLYIIIISIRLRSKSKTVEEA
jgi:uncharacterized membrane protein HdeD (DUF308 family)